MYQSTAPKNSLQQTLHRTSQEVGQPADHTDRISFGIISDVNEETMQVKVRLLENDEQPGEEMSPYFLPVITPLADIHSKYGSLRKGLRCRVFWKGKLSPNQGLVEIIGEEGDTFLKKQPAKNEIDFGPYLLLSGGLSL